MSKPTARITEPVVIAEGRVIVELSVENAQVLRQIMQHIGGSPRTTARGMIGELDVALSEAGIEIATKKLTEFSGSIYFSDL